MFILVEDLERIIIGRFVYWFGCSLPVFIFLYIYIFFLFVSAYVYDSLSDFVCTASLLPFVLGFWLSIFFVCFSCFFSIVFSACYHWICFFIRLLSSFFLSLFLLLFYFFILNIFFYFNNFLFFPFLSFVLSFFLFLSFLLSHVADRVLVLWPGVRPKPLRWESRVQDIGPPETSRPHVISNGESSPRDLHLSTKTQLHSTTSKIQCWTPYAKQLARQEHKPTH